MKQSLCRGIVRVGLKVLSQWVNVMKSVKFVLILCFNSQCLQNKGIIIHDYRKKNKVWNYIHCNSLQPP